MPIAIYVNENGYKCEYAMNVVRSSNLRPAYKRTIVG